MGKLKIGLLKNWVLFLLISFIFNSCQSRKSPDLVSTNGYFGMVSEDPKVDFQKIKELSSGASLKIHQKIQKIAFGSCMDQEKPQPIWEVLNSRDDIDVFLSLGDFVYASLPQTKPIRGAYLKQIQSQPLMIDFKRKVPWLGVWDDHDFGVNDGHGKHEEYVEALASYLAFFTNSAQLIAPNQEGIYHSLLLGPKSRSVQVILLDLRTFKSEWKKQTLEDGSWRYVADFDPKKTMLGEAQWKWLEQELDKPARVRILVSSLQVLSEEHRYEKWANFPRERERLLQLLEKKKLKNILILSGDRHFSEISRWRRKGGGHIYEFTSSSFNRPIKGVSEPNRYRIAGSEYFESNFGLVSIDFSKSEILLQTLGEKGDVVREQKVTIW